MKKSLILIITILLLTACSTTTNPDNGKVNNNSNTNNNSNQNEQTIVDNQNQIVTEDNALENKDIPSELDQVALQGAQTLNDPSYCEKINSPSLKEQCENLFKEPEEQEVKEEDCESYQTQDQKDACNLRKEIENKAIQAQKDAQELEAKEMAIMQEAIDKGNIEMCKQLTLEHIKSMCELNIKKS